MMKKKITLKVQPPKKKNSDTFNINEMPESLKYLLKVIREYFSHKLRSIAWPFTEPVDAVKLKIFDYHDVIKHPMDLGTIKKKLERGQYRNAQDVADDFHLMCENCFTYNPADHVVYRCGESILKDFQTKWKKLPKDSVAEADEKKSVPKTSIALPVENVEQKDYDLKTMITGTKDLITYFSQLINELNSFSNELVNLKIKTLEEKMRGNEYPIPTDILLKFKNIIPLIDNHKSQRSIELTTPSPKMLESAFSNVPIPSLVTNNFNSTPKAPLCSSDQRKNVVWNNNLNQKKPWRSFDFDSDDEAVSIPMTKEEKIKLSEYLNNNSCQFSDRQIRTIISIVEGKDYLNVEYRKDLKDFEYEMDFETINTKILREMETFIQFEQKNAAPNTAKKSVKRKSEIETKISTKKMKTITEITPKNDGLKRSSTSQKIRQSYRAHLSSDEDSSDSSDNDNLNLDFLKSLTPSNSSVQEIVKPTLDKMNPLIDAGNSILDQLLPNNDSQLETKNQKEREGKIKLNQPEEKCIENAIQQKTTTDLPSMEFKTSSYCSEDLLEDEETRILRKKEEARLILERDMDVDLTSQMEMMTNFEASF